MGGVERWSPVTGCPPHWLLRRVGLRLFFYLKQLVPGEIGNECDFTENVHQGAEEQREQRFRHRILELRGPADFILDTRTEVGDLAGSPQSPVYLNCPLILLWDGKFPGYCGPERDAHFLLILGTSA